jgi:hypothetical protein
MPNERPQTDASLQFDRAVSAAGDAGPTSDAIVCAACNSTVRTWYYDVEGAPHCAGCKQKAERNSGAVRDWGLTLRASVFGLGAAIAGALIYFGVIAITQFEIGIVALLIGWMVGWALRKGAGGRGGRRLQVIGAALTYFAVALAYLPLVIKADIDGGISAAAQAQLSSDDDSAPNEVDQPAISDVERTVEPPPFTAGSTADVNPFFAIGLVLVFSLGLPLFVILGSFPSGLISALIIGIGMHQAWSMTRAASLTIAGPFKVGRARSDDASGAAATAA